MLSPGSIYPPDSPPTCRGESRRDGVEGTPCPRGPRSLGVSSLRVQKSRWEEHGAQRPLDEFSPEYSPPRPPSRPCLMVEHSVPSGGHEDTTVPSPWLPAHRVAPGSDSPHSAHPLTIPLSHTSPSQGARPPWLEQHPAVLAPACLLLKASMASKAQVVIVTRALYGQLGWTWDLRVVGTAQHTE